MGWNEQAESYRALIESPDWDSRLLREQGLIPNVLDLVGPCSEAAVLDVGTGTGWLFEWIQPSQSHACDAVEPSKLPPLVMFQRCKAENLGYKSSQFDVVVASLLLMFCEDLGAVCRELRRVAKPTGRLVIALVHPYFYRTGHVEENGNFTIVADLSRPFDFPVRIGEQLGPVTYYYRPLYYYINALSESGWRIRRLRDWFLEIAKYQAYVRAGVRSNVERTQKVPLYSFIECTAELEA